MLYIETANENKKHAKNNLLNKILNDKQLKLEYNTIATIISNAVSLGLIETITHIQLQHEIINFLQLNDYKIKPIIVKDGYIISWA